MSKWREVRFKDVVQFNPRVKLDRNKMYPQIGISDIDESKFNVYESKSLKYIGQSSSKFESGDILFSRITPCLENRKIARVFLKNSDRGFGSTELFVFRGKKNETLTGFVSYLAQTDMIVLPAINSMTGASGRQRADKSFIEKLKIRIPDLKTQEKIADILLTYDELIENNNRRIEILEKTAEEIYKEWFVRMRFPGHENTRFEKGIPEGWEEVKLEDICNLVRGISYSTKEIEKDLGTAMLTLKSVNAYGGYNYDGLRFYDGKISNRHYIKKNDLIMAITDMTQDRRVIGQVCLVPRLYYGELVFSADLILLDDLKIEKSYMYSLLRYGGISRYISTFSNGANVLHLNQRTLNNIRFYIAPEKLRIDYDKIHVDIQGKINNLQLQNQNLAKQRDLLLPRLMNGTVEVK
ncbi:MAG TPA: restriction endonuclease subunit S [Clostridia bacterium]|nr:restriction endonuclease subunit S [Clostridia bacterium]